MDVTGLYRVSHDSNIKKSRSGMRCHPRTHPELTDVEVFCVHDPESYCFQLVVILSIPHSLYLAYTDTEHVVANQVSKPCMGRFRQGGQASYPSEVVVGSSLGHFQVGSYRCSRGSIYLI